MDSLRGSTGWQHVRCLGKSRLLYSVNLALVFIDLPIWLFFYRPPCQSNRHSVEYESLQYVCTIMYATFITKYNLFDYYFIYRYSRILEMPMNVTLWSSSKEWHFGHHTRRTEAQKKLQQRRSLKEDKSSNFEVIMCFACRCKRLSRLQGLRPPLRLKPAPHCK